MIEMDFTQSPPRPGTLEEAQEIINALWQFCIELSKRVEKQQKQISEQQKQIEDLKEKLNTNSKNSSKAPSKDPFKKKPKKKKKSKRKQGGQPGHEGVSRSLLPKEEVDFFEVCKPAKRCECGRRIELTGDYRRHQVHELPMVKATVTEYQLCTGVCCGCQKIHHAVLPVGVPTGMLGHIAMAKVAALTGDYRMSKRNVTHLFEDFHGLKISIGTVSNAEEVVSASLAAPVEEAKDFIPKQRVVNADETSHAEKGAKMWTWICVSMLVAVFVIRASRGSKVIKELLGEKFKGILCTDRWSGYAWMAAIFRQLCWSHLQRDFRKISERSGKSGRLGEELLACAQRMFHYWHKVKDGRLSRERFIKLMKPIRKRVEALLLEGISCGNTKTAGMCKQIFKLKEALWTFVETDGVEPTNNIAEQVIRRIVIWRKTSFGTQSAGGTLYLERIMTVVATCKLQNRNVLHFVTDAVRAHLNGTKSPSLLPCIVSSENTLPEAA